MLRMRTMANVFLEIRLWIIRQVAIRSTIHKLRFTDQTASNWLMKNKTPVMKQTDCYVYLLSLNKLALSVNQKYHMYTVCSQRR